MHEQIGRLREALKDNKVALDAALGCQDWFDPQMKTLDVNIICFLMDLIRCIYTFSKFVVHSIFVSTIISLKTQIIQSHNRLLKDKEVVNASAATEP